jgi:hypothetical protein
MIAAPSERNNDRSTKSGGIIFRTAGAAPMSGILHNTTFAGIREQYRLTRDKLPLGWNKTSLSDLRFQPG